MNSRERFLNACRCQKVDRPPVWIMRQAGRYLPEYRELRRKHAFAEICRTPELAREVALQPLRRFPLDAAILFSDILVVPEAMGLTVDYLEGGPKVGPALDSPFAVDTLQTADAASKLEYVGDAVAAIREGIGPDKALIGFAGAPYTLATYMVEGGSSKRFETIKHLAYRHPETIQNLLKKLTLVVRDFLRMQVERGADAIQIFDTWAGELSVPDFERLALPAVRRIVSGLSDLNVPIIYFVNGVGGKLRQIEQSGADVLGVDFRSSLTYARRRIRTKVSLQGNLDPMELFAPEHYIRQRVRDLDGEMAGYFGHILNLGHGILPDTPIEGVETFVDEVLKLAEDSDGPDGPHASGDNE